MKSLAIFGLRFLLVWTCTRYVHSYCSSDHRCVCQAVGQEVTALCAGKNITVWPIFSKNITDIDLSNNELKDTPNRSHIPHTLKRLDLSSNPINSILEESFQNLHHLEVLNLENTKEIPRVPSTIFKDLTSLKSLNIKNKFPGKHKGYPIEVLLHVPSLESLSLNGNSERFQDNFKTLVNLRTLDISGKGGYCDLRNMEDENYFEHVKNITTLDVSYCQLRNLLKGTFSNLHHLQVLDISYNEELSFSILQNLTSDLKTTDIEVLRMNKIHCTFGRSTMLYRSDITDIQNTSLKELHISSNRLQLLEPGVIIELPKTLEYIAIADNKLTLGWYVFEIGFLKNLRTFDMSLQFLSHYPADMFHLCKDDRNRRPQNRLKSSSVSMNKYQSNTEILPYSTLYSQIFLSMNISLPLNLEIGFFNSCKLQYMIPKNYFGKNSIKAAYLQNNFLHKWIGPVSGVQTLQILDLSNNVCTFMTPYFFDNFDGLQVLNISHNFLGFSIQNDKRGLSFQYLKQLIQLDIASNKIQILPATLFKNLISLQTLILKDNLLTEIGADLHYMNKLIHLDVSQNLLMEIHQKTRDDIDTILLTSDIAKHFTIDISGNPLQCNCDNLQFIKWLILTKARVVYDKNETCHTKFHKDQQISINDISNFLPILQKNCRSYTALVVVAVSVTMAFVTVIVCGLVYRYRWKLRFLYYMTKARYNGRIPRDHNDQYEYDAFISYADEDRVFGFHQMRQKVAEEGNLRLCFHSIDFIPGVDIAENITTAIHSSRRTICVISQDYMNSYWCRYELNMARMESIYSRNGQSVLFLVFYKQCDVNPTILLDLIKSQTYIEYPNDELGDVVFWDMLRRTVALRT